MHSSFLLRSSLLAATYSLFWFALSCFVSEGKHLGVTQILISLPVSFLVFFLLNSLIYGFSYYRWGGVARIFLTVPYLIPLLQLQYFKTYKTGLELQVLSVIIREPGFVLSVAQNEITLIRSLQFLLVAFIIGGMNSWALKDDSKLGAPRGPYFYFSKWYTWLFLVVMVVLQVKWCWEHDKSQLGIRPFYPVILILMASSVHFVLKSEHTKLKKAFCLGTLTAAISILYAFNIAFFNLKEKINLSTSSYISWFGAYFVQSELGNMQQDEDAREKLHQLESAKMDYNILLIVNDSQRWDHLGINGFPKDTTSELSWLLKKSYNFRFPIAPANFTDTSLPGIFYGMGSDQDLRKIKKSLLLWDYFSKGADTFFLSAANLSWSKLNLMLNSVGQKELWSLPLDSATNKTPQEQIEVLAAQRVLERIKSQKGPWVGVWHSEGSHYPYKVPSNHEHYAPCDLTRASGVEPFRNCYLNGTQHSFKLYSDVLKQIDLEHTIVVMTSDHAEGMNEHGVWFHGEGYHQEIVKVPFILYLPEKIEARIPPEVLENLQANTQKVISVMDLTPTLLHLHQYLTGQKLYDDLSDYSGRSLLTQWTDRVIYSSHCYPQYRCYSREILLVDENYYGIYNPASGLKLIYDTWGDPEQKNPLNPKDIDPEKFKQYLKNAAATHPLAQNILSFYTNTLAGDPPEMTSAE